MARHCKSCGSISKTPFLQHFSNAVAIGPATGTFFPEKLHCMFRLASGAWARGYVPAV